ncbi:MAG TPA: hypothetical protein GX510_08480 [Firmicutes bacterium]|nr:hypothetical protein [Candidatus Fermentithermobacillaceae bacterium]
MLTAKPSLREVNPRGHGLDVVVVVSLSHHHTVDFRVPDYVIAFKHESRGNPEGFLRLSCSPIVSDYRNQ